MSENRYIFTDKGREHISISNRKWVDLSEKELYDEIGLVFLLWAGHNKVDVTTEPEMVEAVSDLLAGFVAHIST